MVERVRRSIILIPQLPKTHGCDRRDRDPSSCHPPAIPFGTRQDWEMIVELTGRGFELLAITQPGAASRGPVFHEFVYASKDRSSAAPTASPRSSSSRFAGLPCFEWRHSPPNGKCREVGMLDDITELRTFVSIVGAGSLSAAAREMELALSVVSKRLASLERRAEA